MARMPNSLIAFRHLTNARRHVCRRPAAGLELRPPNQLTGLAIASDIGIFVQTASLAILLHRKRLVSFAHLEYAELARALFAAAIAYAATAVAAHFLPPVSTHPRDVLTIAAASLAWAAAAALTLLATGSQLPRQILRRR